MSTDLAGKRCLIVGASSGIGAAVAQRFGALGVRLAVHCNDNRDGAEAVADAIRAAGGDAVVVQGNIADGEIAAGLIDKAGVHLGGLDILVNNAGSMFGRTAIADATDEQYDQVVSLNIGGVFFASRRAAQLMRAQRSGTIINTTSVAARTGGYAAPRQRAVSAGAVRALAHPLAGPAGRACQRRVRDPVHRHVTRSRDPARAGRSAVRCHDGGRRFG